MTNPFIGEQASLQMLWKSMLLLRRESKAEELEEYQFSEFCQKNLFTDDPDIFT